MYVLVTILVVTVLILLYRYERLSFPDSPVCRCPSGTALDCECLTRRLNIISPTARRRINIMTPGRIDLYQMRGIQFLVVADPAIGQRHCYTMNGEPLKVQSLAGAQMLVDGV